MCRLLFRDYGSKPPAELIIVLNLSIMDEELIERILRLEKELKSTKYLVIFLILMFIILAWQYISVQQKNAISVDMVRTRGLIIKGRDGKDAVLMGYPLPLSETRKRTDPLDGFLMLDQYGNDRLFVGKEGALQNNDKMFNRIDQGWGFLVNDGRGNERGNFSILDSMNSVILGLDYPTGEGIMMVAQPGSAFLVINADTSGPERERIILMNELDGREETYVRIGNGKNNDPLILKASETGNN
jgi:hypothetical protein